MTPSHAWFPTSKLCLAPGPVSNPVMHALHRPLGPSAAVPALVSRPRPAKGRPIRAPPANGQPASRPAEAVLQPTVNDQLPRTIPHLLQAVS